MKKDDDPERYEDLLKKDMLREDTLLILNDINNYSTDYDLSKKLYCKLCKKEIEEPYLPFILWNKNRELYISFHLECIIKPEKVNEFFEIVEKFNYTYEIKDEKANF